MPAETGIDALPRAESQHGNWAAELPASLQATEDARYAAMLAGDARTLARLLSDDLAYTHSNGQTDDKRAYLEAAYSARSRAPFRCDGGQHSAVMADTVPR